MSLKVKITNGVQSLKEGDTATEIKMLLLEGDGTVYDFTGKDTKFVVSNRIGKLFERPVVTSDKIGEVIFSFLPGEITGSGQMFLEIHVQDLSTTRIFPSSDYLVISIDKNLNIIGQTVNSITLEQLKDSLAVELGLDIDNYNAQFEQAIDSITSDVKNGIIDSAKLNWKSPVANFSALSTTYPSAVTGDAALTLDDNKTYRFNGTSWLFIQQFGVGPFTDVYDRLNKQKYFVNVKEFGAVSDGIANDTSAVQAAHDALPSSGGVIFFPVGTTVITNLTLTKAVSLIGVGYTSIVKVSGSITTPLELTKKLLVRDLKLVGVGNTVLLNINKTWSPSSSVTFELSNVWFHNQDGQGKLLQVYGARESGITGCWFTSGITTGASQTEAVVFLADANGGAMNIQVNGCQFHHLKTAINGVGDENNHQFLAGLRLINNMMISVTEGYKIQHADYVLIEQSMLDFVDKPVYGNRIANLKLRNNYFAVRGDLNDAVVVENTKAGYQMQWLDIANNRIFSYASNKGNAIVINSNAGDITYGNISNNDIDLVNKSIVLKGSNGGRSMNLKVDRNRSRDVQIFIELNAGSENNDLEYNYAEISALNFIVNNNPSGGNRLNKGNRHGIKRSQNKGKLIVNGDGTTTLFSTNHNLFSTANHAIATAGSTAIRSIPFHITYDIDKVYFNFATAPASGTNNVILNWEAEI